MSYCRQTTLTFYLFVCITSNSMRTDTGMHKWSRSLAKPLYAYVCTTITSLQAMYPSICKQTSLSTL
jgi:hypothetical protein